MKAPRLSLLSLCAAALLAQAQSIRIDGSTGAPAQTLQGPNYLIPQQLGRLVGRNLFHSFQHFDLQAQESASFTLQSPEISHVIARVTGGTPSLLYGTLRLQPASGKPALLLINPAGVLIGEGFSLDVPGGFHLSTAPQLRMADGSRWESSGGDSFSAAAPEAFGFLGSAAPIYASGATVQGAPGQRLQLAAGDIGISGGLIDASGGLHLAAVGAQSAEVPLQGEAGVLSGLVTIGDAGLLRASTHEDLDAGALRIDAGSLGLFDGAGLRSRTRLNTSGNAGAVQLQLRDSLLMSELSFIESVTGTAGAGGRIELDANAASLTGGAYVWSYSLAEGQAGAIDLRLSDSLLMTGEANLYSSSLGAGAGAKLSVRAPFVGLSEGAYLASVASGSGASGAIDVEASQGLLMRAAELIGLIEGSGNGGNIRLASQGLLMIDEGSRISVSAVGSGRSGLLSLSGALFSLSGGSRVSHAAFGLASTGETWLGGSESLRIDSGAELRATSEGQSTGAIRLQGGDVLIGTDAYLFNSAQGPGSLAGDLRVEAQGLLSIDGATLVNRGIGGGQAGQLMLRAAELFIGGASQLSSSSNEAGSAAGSIELTASRSLLLVDGATLTSATFSERAAGDIKVQAPSIHLDGASLATSSFEGGGDAGRIELRADRSLHIDASVLQSATNGGGNAGQLFLAADDLRIGSASLIFASVGEGGSGRGGDIRLQASRSLVMDGGSAIDTSTIGFEGDAGNVHLSAGASLLIDDARVGSLSGNGSLGRAGEVRLDSAGDLTLRQRATVSTSTAGPGAAGSIALQGRTVHVRDGSLVTASASANSSGQSGSIELSASDTIRLEGQSALLISSDANVADPAALARTEVRLQAPRITLQNAIVAANATGNVNASGVALLAGDSLSLSDSLVSTTAQNGNGGPLRAEAGALLQLQRSALITSVFGNQGNGGDIDVRAALLFLVGGFIQANTAATDASGGDVRIATRALVASDNRVVVGGDAPLSYDPQRPLNVIQAAAPDGVSGTVSVSNTLDIAGSLALLDRSLLDPGGLGRGPCDRREGSSLSQAGRGGLPPSPLMSSAAPTPAAPVVARLAHGKPCR